MKRKITLIICLFLIFVYVFLALFSNIFSTYPYDFQDLDNIFASPSRLHFFGTDNYGRDIYSRSIYAIRNSLFVCFSSIFISFSLFIFFSFLRFLLKNRFFDNVLEFIFNVFLSIPTVPFLLLLTYIMGHSLGSLVVCFTFIFTPTIYRNLSKTFNDITNLQYVLSECLLGTPRSKVFFVHVFYDLMIPVYVQFSFYLSRAIIAESTLSFLGFGISKPTPSLGNMISETKNYLMIHPEQTVYISLILFVFIYSITIFGDVISSIYSSKK